MPVILATQEAEIKRIKPGKKKMIPYLKNTQNKHIQRADRVAQVWLK
jgi:ASC-1-like (ASCH) protein